MIYVLHIGSYDIFVNAEKIKLSKIPENIYFPMNEDVISYEDYD